MSGGGVVVSFVGEQDSAASVGDGVEHNNPGSGDLVYDLIWAVVWLLQRMFHRTTSDYHMYASLQILVDECGLL